MKAILVSQYGGPEALEVTDVPEPAPGPDEVAITVSHAAVGLIDVLIRRGALADYDLLMQPPYVPGIEVAGTVRAVGENVTTLKVGDRVSTLSIQSGGGYAEVMVAPAAVTFPLPDDVDPAQAVVVLPNATTAYLTLTRVVPLAQGAKVLVLGATGALASVFAPVAKRLGASEVVGTVRSAGRVAEAQQLGFDRVVLSGELAEALEGETFDIIIDPVSGELRGRSLQFLAPMGRLVAVGSADSSGHVADTDDLWLGNRGIIGFAVGPFLADSPQAAAPAAAEALSAIADGAFSLAVATYPLDDAVAAHTLMDKGGVSGRLALTVYR